MGKKIGFESLEDLGIMILGKLLEDYCLVFSFKKILMYKGI
jgi:hypothetical protein